MAVVEGLDKDYISLINNKKYQLIT